MLPQGSVARDHLAGERTFLAWLRTSLSLVSLGIAIAQLLKLPEIVNDDGSSVDSGSDPAAGLWLMDAADGVSGRLSSLERL